MLLKDRLKSIFDVFSRREATRDPHKPDDIPKRLRNRILLLYRDVVSGSGQWERGRFAEDHTFKFWSQMHNSLEHLHGRLWLSDVREQYRGMPDCHTADALWA